MIPFWTNAFADPRKHNHHLNQEAEVELERWLGTYATQWLISAYLTLVPGI